MPCTGVTGVGGHLEPTDTLFLRCSIPWVPGLPEVGHSTTEDPEHRGYRSTRLWGQWHLQSVSLSNGDQRWRIGSPGVMGQGIGNAMHTARSFERQPILRPYFWPILKSMFIGFFLTSYAFGMWHN